MKTHLLLGCLLILTACGQMPEERLASLEEALTAFETNGAADEMPEQFRALQDSFAQLRKEAEAEQEKLFSSFSDVERKLDVLERDLDDLGQTIYDRSARFRTLYTRLTREASLGILLYGNLPKEKARTLPARMKETLQQTTQPMRLVRELMQAKTLAHKMEILTPLIEALEETNAEMKSRLDQKTYEQCVEKIESQLKKSNAGSGYPAGLGPF